MDKLKWQWNVAARRTEITQRILRHRDSDIINHVHAKSVRSRAGLHNAPNPYHIISETETIFLVLRYLQSEPNRPTDFRAVILLLANTSHRKYE